MRILLMKRWVEMRKGADFAAIAAKFNISPMLARIIRNREVVGDEAIDEFLNGGVRNMHDPALLKDIDKAALRIISAIEKHEKIRVIGDYDIDGICATYILKRAFVLMGADADACLPDRIADGYGLNKKLIDNAAEDGIDLIVTCDNGIAAAQEIAYAADLGIDVVVTDHHEVPYNAADDDKEYILPCAVAVVDPKQEDCKYPYKGICGGMVAYKLIVYITSQREYSQYCRFITDKVMEEFLTLAAFATVGDVMDLLDENRIAVKRGLELMAHTENTGLRALIEVCGLDKNHISAYHIGFILGPCMNATGRLDSALRALELLECSDYEKTVLMATELKDLNESRKNMTVTYTQQALRLAEKMDKEQVLVIYLPDCHESLAGIVAGRVREKFYKPAIVLTDSAEGVKGSGRSIEAYDMFGELSRVKDIFTKFGGHKMAAGMSLESDKTYELKRRLNENADLSEDELTEKQMIDMVLPISYATIELAREIECLAPFGVGNPKPNFAAKNVFIEDLKLVGKNKNVLRMKLKSEGSGMAGGSSYAEGIMFEDAENNCERLKEIEGSSAVSILYQLDINSYMGRESVQLIIKDIKC